MKNHFFFPPALLPALAASSLAVNKKVSSVWHVEFANSIKNPDIYVLYVTWKMFRDDSLQIKVGNLNSTHCVEKYYEMKSGSKHFVKSTLQ